MKQIKINSYGSWIIRSTTGWFPFEMPKSFCEYGREVIACTLFIPFCWMGHATNIFYQKFIAKTERDRTLEMPFPGKYAATLQVLGWLVGMWLFKVPASSALSIGGGLVTAICGAIVIALICAILFHVTCVIANTYDVFVKPIIDKRRLKKKENPSLIREWIHAKKNKYCPTVEYVD
jgi:hypothetical protein